MYNNNTLSNANIEAIFNIQVINLIKLKYKCIFRITMYPRVNVIIYFISWH